MQRIAALAGGIEAVALGKQEGDGAMPATDSGRQALVPVSLHAPLPVLVALSEDAGVGRSLCEHCLPKATEDARASAPGTTAAGALTGSNENTDDDESRNDEGRTNSDDDEDGDGTPWPEVPQSQAHKERPSSSNEKEHSTHCIATHPEGEMGRFGWQVCSLCPVEASASSENSIPIPVLPAHTHLAVGLRGATSFVYRAGTCEV